VKKNCSIFNNFVTIGENNMRDQTQVHPHSSSIFQQYQECNKRCCSLGDLNVTNKTKQTNKQTYFIDRNIGRYRGLQIGFPNWMASNFSSLVPIIEGHKIKHLLVT
jgi:hypothetical protein